ncbi:MAG: GNAT family N-acetyltransferase [Pseudomonadota bacterium]
MVTLRISGPDDQAEVTRLLELSYGQLMPAAYGRDWTDEHLPIIAKANPDLLSSGTYYLAVAPESQVVGAGGWTRERPGTGEIEAGLGHIRHVATDPGWIGKGIGRALMERCAADAERVGIHRFECYASLNAVNFYKHVGFQEIRAVDVRLGGDRIMPSCLMEWIL